MTRPPVSFALPIAAIGAAVLAFAVFAGTETRAQGQPRQGEWRHYSGDLAATKYSPLDQINRSNVSSSASPGGDRRSGPTSSKANPAARLSNNYRSTPLMINGVLFATNAVGVAEAFDPETGRTPVVAENRRRPRRQPRSRRRASSGGALERADRARASSPITSSISTRSTRKPERSTATSAAAGASTSSVERPVPLERAAARRPRRRHRRLLQSRSGLLGQDGRERRRSAGIRRADRQAAVDVPRDSARRRARRRRPSRTNRGDTSAPATSGRR